jgi:hypothetical protein
LKRSVVISTPMPDGTWFTTTGKVTGVSRRLDAELTDKGWKVHERPATWYQGGVFVELSDGSRTFCANSTYRKYWHFGELKPL